MKTQNELNKLLLEVMSNYEYVALHEAIPLIHEGADPNLVISEDGKTCLMGAAEELETDLVKVLADHGADINCRDVDGSTALHYVCFSQYNWELDPVDGGGAETIDALLEAGANINDSDNDGNSPFLLAARKPVPGAVQILFERGANINHVNKDGLNALQIAAPRMSFDCLNQPDTNARTIDYLIKIGVDTNHHGADGRTPLVWAIDSGNYPSLQTMLDNGVSQTLPPLFAPYEPILWAVTGNTDSLKANDFPANLRSKTGMTPLMWATVAGQEAAVIHLLDRGANINDVDNDGWTALMFAVDRANEPMVRLLLAKGADQNVLLPPDSGFGGQQYTVLMWAMQCNSSRERLARSSHREICRLLLHHGDADLSRVYPALASRGNLPELLWILVRQGQDVSIEDAVGTGDLELIRHLSQDWKQIEGDADLAHTVLMGAISWNQVEVVKALVAVGVDIDAIKGSSSFSPLMEAVRERHPEIISVLIEAGADIKQTNAYGMTAIKIAERVGDDSLTALLRSRNGNRAPLRPVK